MQTTTVDLKPRMIDAAAFAPYGTLLPPHEDGKLFGPDEGQLELSRGTPRFYVMRLAGRPSGFRRITRHLCVTQCLAAVGGGSWLIAVCPPDDPDNPGAKPDLERMAAFEVPGDVAILLHRSTWHAGPFFEGPRKDFFNLELADTNQIDHHSVDLAEAFGRIYRFGAGA